MAMEFRRIGPNEVRITKVYTVEATHEFSGEHDPTPNWRERAVPNLATGAFNLRIEAEAGATIGGGGAPYQLVIQGACLTNPLAALPGNLNLILAGAFNAASGWELQQSGEMYTNSWSITLPTFALFQAPPIVKQVDETWQLFVSLEDSAAPNTPMAFGCYAASEPFRLIV